MFNKKNPIQPPHVDFVSNDEDLYAFDSQESMNPFTTDYSRTTTRGIVKTANIRTGTKRVGSSRQGPGTASGRPITANRAAGYTSRVKTAKASANTLETNEPIISDAPTLEETQEELYKKLELKINDLINEGYILAEEGEFMQAVERVKEAEKRDKQLNKQREQAELQDQMNYDLTFFVQLSLAHFYECAGLFQEALNTYASMVKNKSFGQAGRLRVNMGNIYFHQQKYIQAIKMYRMALDQIPNTNKRFRMSIMRNIGHAFVKTEEFQDAMTSYESVMEGYPDFAAGFNLLLCYYATGDQERMKRGFTKLVSIKPMALEVEIENGSDADFFDDVLADELKQVSMEIKKKTEHFILLGSKLLAPSIENSFAEGYDWIVETLKNSPQSQVSYALEMSKAVEYLRSKEFTKAIETFKEFEKRDGKLLAEASINLSFLYFLLGELEVAEKYADMAVDHDKYNAKALTNRGNCYYASGDYELAKEFYHDAISVDASCVEAIYNLGLVNKKMILYEDALPWFERLHSLIRGYPEIIFQIADIHEKLDNIDQALEWYNILLSVTPTDPGVLSRLGEIYNSMDDKSQAYQYYSESFRYNPCDLKVLAWLGTYYLECDVYEKAARIFEKASSLVPNEPKWQLLAANCYRKSSSYQQALEAYKAIHVKFPDNVECKVFPNLGLSLLVRLCLDLNLPEVQVYREKLTKAEKTKEAHNNGELPVETKKEESKKIGFKENKKARFKDETETWQEDVGSFLPE